MNILIAAGVPKRREGGVAGIVYGTGRGLEERGHQVDYLFADDLPKTSWLPGRFHELDFSIRLERFIRQHGRKYSVVNLHAPAGFAFGLIRRLSPGRRKTAPAYVVTLHGLEERRVYNLGREARKGVPVQFGRRNRLWHALYHMPRFYFAITTADHALCVGREVWTILQLKYNLDPDQTSYSPTGVEERFFTTREHSHRAGARLLYAGTWLTQRGIFEIREALGNLAPRLPDLRLTIAGCGSDAAAIKNFFDPVLQPMIDVLPIVPSDQMPALFAEHDIFVFPSIMEGTPLAVQEAMASGMAVITTETCGMIDLIEHNWNGWLLRLGDSQALQDAIRTLSQNFELRARLGQAAQQTMRRFTWERTLDTVEDAFRCAMRRAGHEEEFVSARQSVPAESLKKEQPPTNCQNNT